MKDPAIKEDRMLDWLTRTWIKPTGIDRIGGKQVQLQSGPVRERHYWLIAAASQRGGVVIDGQFCPLRSGGVRIGSAGERLEWVDRDPEGQGAYLLRFIADDVPDAGHPEMDGERRDTPFSVTGEYQLMPAAVLIDKCRTIERSWRSGNAAERLYGEAAFCELLGMVLSSGFQGVAAGLERARQELLARFGENVPVDRLAELAGLSRYHFMRLFKEMEGKSVGDYVTELRLNEAKRLMLGQEKLPLRIIAEQVGYGDAAYFSRQFKKWTGLSPSLYIRNRSRKVAAYSWANVGQLLPLDIIPYAAPIDQYWTDYYRRKYQADVAVLLSHDYDFNLQALRRAQPDCIVALDYNMPDEEREKLEQIAPVLLIPWEGTDWRGHLRAAAAYMDKSKEAESWLCRYDRKVDQAMNALPDALRERPTLLLKISARRLLVLGRRAAALFYEDLRIPMPAASANGNDWLHSVSAEQLTEYAAANIVVSVNEDAASRATWEQLQQSAVWRGLPAVRDGAVYRLSGSSWFEFPWGEYTAFNHEQMLSELVSGALGSL